MTDDRLDRIVAEPQVMDARGFETLREFARHGYEPDPRALPGSTGIVLRHAAAPDLVLYPDGRVELSRSQGLKAGASATASSGRRISWRRGLLFLFLLVAYTVISAFVIINLIAD